MDNPHPFPTELLIIRHGESRWNADGRWQGQADPELSERGRDQAARAAAALAGTPIDRVVSSDLRRARTTASIIAGGLGLDEPEVEIGLREIDVGDWTGMTRPEIERKWPTLLESWTAGKLESTPGGETLTALRARITRAVHGLMGAGLSNNAPTGGVRGRILVVTHRRAISALEEAYGVRPVRAGNLAGRRFFSTGPGDLAAGDPIDLLALQPVRRPSGT